MFKHLGKHPVPAHGLPLLLPESHSLSLLIRKDLGLTFPGGELGLTSRGIGWWWMVVVMVLVGVGGVCVRAHNIVEVFIHFSNSLNLFLLEAVVHISTFIKL